MHTFADPLKRALQIAPERTAVISGDAAYTYRALHERCQRLAGARTPLGAARGERGAILAGNCHAHI